MLDVILSECQRPSRRSPAGQKADHGLSWTRFYKIWNGMISRCYNPRHTSYPRYGGKGIAVCQRWHDFRLFIQDMASGYYHGATLDRIDNCQGYYKENCRWATMKEQQRNRTSNTLVTVNGVTKCLVEWQEELGCNKHRLGSRVWKMGAQKAVEITMSLPKGSRIKRRFTKVKVSKETVEQIIEMILQGKRNCVIAKHFGLDHKYISQVKMGQNRTEVRPDVPRPIKPKSDQSVGISTLEVKPVQLHFEKKESTV